MGKIVIATFNDDEEIILEKVISLLGKDCITGSITSSILRFEHELEIYPQYRRVIVNNKEINLSQHEYEVLYFLAQYPGWVFSKEQIYEAVWHLESNSCFSAVTNTVSRLRKKIEPDPQFPIYIQTMPGQGYKFCPQLVNIK